MSGSPDQTTVELSRRLSATLDQGDIPEALRLMAQLRPLYLAAWNEAINGKARRNGPESPAADDSDSLTRELEEYRKGGFD